MALKSLIRLDISLSHRTFVRGVSSKSPWDIITGVCVERLPIVTPPLNDMQKKFKAYLAALEVENSLKSDHELRHEQDKIQLEKIRKESADVDLESVSKVTAQDFEDAANDEFAKFKLADIVTEADKKGDKTSLERCLQNHLIMVTPLKLGNDLKTILPQAKWKEGETLRQTAERIVFENCGPELKVKFLSNAPCGFYKYKYPSEIDGKIGAKVFFYYANYKSGKVTTPKVNWITRNEMSEIFPERYNKSVREFLFDEAI